MEQLDPVEKPVNHTPVKMDMLFEQQMKGRIVLRADQLSGHIPGTTGSRLLWKPYSFHVREGDKLAIIGPNGSGKTTLIKKIVHQDEFIAIPPSIKIGYFSQTIDILDENETILDNVGSSSSQQETLIRSVLARLHFYRDDVFKPIRVLSGGERVKVALAKLFVSDIHMLILDEPTNYLDIEALEALESLLQG